MKVFSGISLVFATKPQDTDSTESSVNMICGLVYIRCVATMETVFTFIFPAKDSAEQANHFLPPSINFQYSTVVVVAYNQGC